MNPLLFMDIDGTMLPNCSHKTPPSSAYELIHVPLLRAVQKHLIHRDIREAIPTLERLFDWHWCTWWMDSANGRLGHALAMHHWPVVPLMKYNYKGEPKWEAVQKLGEGRALAWCDDAEIPNEAYEWAENRNKAGIPTLIVRTDSPTGMSAKQVQELLAFGKKHGQMHTDMPHLAKKSKTHTSGIESKIRFL